MSPENEIYQKVFVGNANVLSAVTLKHRPDIGC